MFDFEQNSSSFSLLSSDRIALGELYCISWSIDVCRGDIIVILQTTHSHQLLNPTPTTKMGGFGQSRPIAITGIIAFPQLISVTYPIL